MEEKRIKRYPIGVQTFNEIIEGGYHYIDKTGYVYEIGNAYKYVFLSRPRRFGKSLLTTTFHSYFAGEKELFDGLKAGELEKEWRKHPVFHFDMSTAKHLNEKQLLRTLGYKLSAYESTFGKDSELKEEDINARFERLVKIAVEQTGEKAVIIIDEYDSPLLDVMNDPARLAPMRQIMRNFYSPIKSLDPYLRFVFITGITKFAQLSIFSELNNLMNISMLPKYSAVCGISQTEIETQMKDSVTDLASGLGISYGEALEKLKENYDGYHFCDESEDIYNPYSLIKALDTQRFGSYWFESGTPTFLIERMDSNPIDEMELDSMTDIPESAFDISPELCDDTLPMLYQAGYLTIKGYDQRTKLYSLGYPNEEVKIGFTECLLARYNSKRMSGNMFVAKFSAALNRDDINDALQRMQSYMAGIPYDLENKTEKHFQTIIYLVFSLLGYYIHSEVKSAVGRADAVCRTQDCVYVFEFKVDSSAEVALKQIDDKGYLIPYKFEYDKADKSASMHQNKLVKVGVNISTETRTIEDWKVEEVLM